VFDPAPHIVRTVRLAEAGQLRSEPTNADYPLKREQLAFQRELAALGTGVIDVIKVHDGVPVSLEFHEHP
jgi:hypothetical protein